MMHPTVRRSEARRRRDGIDIVTYRACIAEGLSEEEALCEARQVTAPASVVGEAGEDADGHSE
jgi:hypothetical protein